MSWLWPILWCALINRLYFGTLGLLYSLCFSQSSLSLNTRNLDLCLPSVWDGGLSV